MKTSSTEKNREASDKAAAAPVRAAGARATKAVALCWTAGDARKWAPAIRAFAAERLFARVIVCADPNSVAVAPADNVIVRSFASIAEAAAFAAGDAPAHLLIAFEPTLFAPDALAAALAFVEADPRRGSVSFLTNAGGYFSFPHRNAATPVPPPGHDERTIVERLRRSAGGPAFLPVPVCDGPAVLFGASALALSGAFLGDDEHGPAFPVIEMSLRLTRRGFSNFLDLTTFALAPLELASGAEQTMSSPMARAALYARHPFFPGCYDDERDRPDSLVAQGLAHARTKLSGLSVLIDASALGPQQMGTQLLLRELSLALASCDDVRQVFVGVPDPANLPPYCDALRHDAKIRLTAAGALHFPDMGHVDILHRPFQPTGPVPWERWRQIARRSIITIQDLIAYRNGSYFDSYQSWRDYRLNLGHACASADGVVAISRDVVDVIAEERLRIAAGALFEIPNGVDHLAAPGPSRIPSAFLAPLWATAEFVLVLGATYAHKNRDAAIRIWRALRADGRAIKLVLVGAHVPFGSSRLEEAAEGADDPDILVLPDVVEAERNWLMRNAAINLYTTSAEGFGQIPFESAQMGRPSVYVAFGPLRENIVNDEAPRRFDVDELAGYCRRLLNDPQVAARNVAALKRACAELTWRRTAERSVAAYLRLLGDFWVSDAWETT